MRRFFRRLRRTTRLIRVYWTTVEGDWSAIALVMRHEIHAQRMHMLQHNLIQDVESFARPMLVAERALDRLLNGPWADDPEDRESKRLARMMRYLTYWWD